MNYQTSKNGISIDISIGDSDHRFSKVENGVTYEYLVKSFRSDYKGKSVVVEYAEIVKDNQGGILRSKSKSYTEDNSLRYAGLYALNGFSEPAGDFYGKQCVNGIMEREVGFKAFDNAGELIDHSA